MRFSSVDLPEPEGPMMASVSPRYTTRSTSRTASTGGSPGNWRPTASSTTGASAATADRPLTDHHPIAFRQRTADRSDLHHALGGQAGAHGHDRGGVALQHLDT